MNQRDQHYNQQSNDEDENEDHDYGDDHDAQPQVEVVTDTYRNKQFDVTYNEDDFENQQIEQEDQHHQQQQEYDDEDEEDEEDEDDNPMAKKLKKMKQQLRNQIQQDESKEEVEQHHNANNRKSQNEEDEDNQGYDGYKSPHKAMEQKLQPTPPNQMNVKQQQQQEEQKKQQSQISQGQQLPTGNIIGAAANYNQIKNSKLFQKFLQKETGQKQKEDPQALQSTSSKISLQQFAATPNKGKQPSPAVEKPKSQWGNKQKQLQEQQQKQKQKQQENFLDISHQTHDDFYDAKVRPQEQQRQQQQQYRGYEPAIDLSLDGIHHNPNNQFLDDSQFYNPNVIVGGHQHPDHLYPPYFHNNMKSSLDNKAYLLDQSELNNEGELIGYSEQILGKINDMAPGIPNQDEVLCHQPPEMFVNMMHDQFNNEMPWLIRNRTNNLDKSRELPFSNAPQNFDYQQLNVQPIKQEMHQMKEEMRRMKEDYEYVNDKFANLQDKYNRLQADYDKDKTFYEEALEARMNQLEQLENENEMINRNLEETRRNEMDLQAQIDQIMFDKEMMQRNLTSTDRTKQELGKKEEELYNQIRTLQDQLREKEFEADRGMGDQGRLKTQIERNNQEVERLKQQIDYSEQSLNQKDQEKQSVMSQMNDLKQRLQQEQTDQHYVRNENEEFKNEILMLKQQINMSNNVQEQLRSQLFEIKDRMGEVEHREFLANSTKELMQKEIQQLRMQLNQANQFIQQQAMFYTQAQASGNMQQQQQKPPVFQVQTTKWDDDSFSTQSRESAVPTTQANKKRGDAQKQGSGSSDQQPQFGYGGLQQSQHHQLRSNNVSNLLQWDDQPIGMPPPRNNNQRPQTSKPQINNAESNVVFPRRGGIQQDMNSSVSFPSRQQQLPETSISFPSRGGPQKNSQQDNNSNVAFPSRQQKSMSSFEGMDQALDQRASNKMQQKNLQSVTTLNKPQIEQRQKHLQNIENNLLQLNLERDKFKSEFDKIPDNAKTIAQRRRKDELEMELGILGKNITSLKTKLRDIESQH